MEKDGFREYIMSKESVLVDSDMSWRSFDDRQRVTPLDLMKIRRENPDLFFSKYFGNNLKHKPMKKYRVVTDNLMFAGIVKDSIFSIDNGYFASETGVPLKSWLNSMSYLLLDAIKFNPEWFSEIKEKEHEVTGNIHDLKYSEADMIAFGETVKSKYDFNNQNATVCGLFKSYKAEKFSPKEEPKEFTKEDMCMFASYAHCYHSKKLSYDALLSEWVSYYHHK